jgi:hypothetical protein
MEVKPAMEVVNALAGAKLDAEGARILQFVDGGGPVI